MTRPWPPTLPEFLNLCRPPFDYEAAYHHAGEQVRLRAYQCDRWNSPAIYWAASELGNDLREPYQRMKGRWAAAVDAARRGIASGRLDSCVPPCMPAIAPPPPSSIDERRRRINEISLTFGSRKHAATLEQKSISNVAPT